MTQEAGGRERGWDQGTGSARGEGRALREGTALRSGGRAVPSDSRNSGSRGECGPWRIPQEVLGSCERAKSGPVWTQDAAPELRCRRLPRDSVLSPFLPSHAFFLRSLGPEASPTVACDPPRPGQSLPPPPPTREGSVSALASLGARQRRLSPEGMVGGPGGDVVPSRLWA